MSGWVKVSAEWFESDEVEDVGADVAMLHLSALAYSARQMTDGRIPRRQLRRLWPVDDLDQAVRVLVDAGWWEAIGDGYAISTWRDHLLSADEVERKRASNRERQERFRRHKAGDHSMCQRCTAVRGNALRNGLSHGVSNAPPIRSDPSVPTGRRGGQAGGKTADPDNRVASPPFDPDCPDCTFGWLDTADDDGRILATRCHCMAVAT